MPTRESFNDKFVLDDEIVYLNVHKQNDVCVCTCN